MKEIWKKTSLLYKMIALLLTVVMVGTTLYFHFEKKYVAKAEGETLTVGYYYNDVSEEKELKWFADSSKKNEDYYYLKITNNNVDIKRIKLAGKNASEGYDDGQIATLSNGQSYNYYIKGENSKDYKVYYSTEESGENWTEGCEIKRIVWSDDPALNLSVGANIADNTIGDTSKLYPTKDSQLVVNITSGYKLATLKILGMDVDLTSVNESVDNNYEQTDSNGVKISKSIDTDIFRYVYTVTYTFTGESNKNWGTEVVSVTDTNTTPQTKNITCSELIYDVKEPVISASINTDPPTSIVESDSTTDWLKGNKVTFTVKSDEETVHSPISNLVIKVNGTEKPTTCSGDNYIIDLENGTYTIVVTATDGAGKSTEKTYAVNLDTAAPTITSIDVSENNKIGTTNYVKLNNNIVIISGVVTDNVSGIPADFGLEFKGTKDESNVGGTTHGYTLEETSTDNPRIYKYSIDLRQLLGSAEAIDLNSGSMDGNYKIWVIPKDKAGNNSTYTESEANTISFVLDTRKPVVEEKAIQAHKIGDLDDKWTEVSTGDNKYLVNKLEYDRIRYKVKVTDENFDNLKFVYMGDEKDKVTTKATGDYYYYEVPMGEIGNTTAIKYSIIAEDKAKNATDNIDLPELQAVDTSLIVNLKSISDNNGSILSEETVATDDISSYFANKDFNGFYTIKLQVKSGYKIKEVTLKKGENVYKAYTTADLDNNQDTTTGIWSTKDISFAIPADENMNEQLSNMSICVEDTNPTESEAKKIITLGELLYDRTQPVVANNSSLDTNKWYQEYTLNYEVKSGEDIINVPESILTSASYAIDGGAASSIDVSSSVKSKTGSVDIPESKSIAGTKIVFDAKDKATNTIDTASVNYPNSITVKVDKTAPKVDEIKVNGESVSEENILAGVPQLTSTITDNLTVKDYSVSVKYNDEMYVEDYHVSVEKDASQESISHTLQQVLGSKELKDGKYTVSISAKDKSERTSNVSTTSFIVDNTVPVLGASIISGTTGKNNGYYNTDVVVRLTCKDNNFNPSAMTVTDNGSAINANWQVGNDIYYADVTLSAEGLHDIRVTGNDKAGTAAEAKQVTFIIDKTVPTVSLLVNGGQVYNESRGTLNLTGPLTLTASVSDTNEDAGDLRVQIIKTVPDTATSTSEFLPTGERTFSFADEADYVVNVFAVDRANNQGPTRTISFRVDTTAPQLTITGANGGTASSATSVSFNITEAFWSDAKGTVEIYRKAGDGVDEALYKTLTISPTQRAYSLSELLRESGIYRFEFTADDKVGHTATASQKITVDVNKPEITLSGVNNYDSTDGAVSISAIIKDEFYASKKVSIQGTRTDAAGKKTALSFSPFAATANPTTINDTFSEEGIYDITLTATDIAGNVTSNSVHFTIDTSKPVIGDLSKYDGKTFNAKTFEELGLDINLDEIVTDLTVCQVRMYLNGSEYDGMADIEDGSYTLLITAEDELGHKSEKSATFVLDTKEPIFIVTGVEDGEIRNDNYNIEVSLQLDEDTLDEVKLNDKVITVKNNVATFDVTDKGEYELYMKATDEAGNEASQTIKFTFGEESVATAVSNAVEKAASHWWLWAIVVAAILAVCGIIFFILKRRNEE